MTKYEIYSILWFIYGIALFIGFAYHIEYDRQFSTWMWLLSSCIGFYNSLRWEIKNITK